MTLYTPLIYDRHQPDNGTIPLYPPDGPAGELYTHTDHLIQIAPHILPSHDAITQQEPVAGLTIEKILKYVTSCLFLVFLVAVRKKGSKAIRENDCPEGQPFSSCFRST